MVTTLRTCPGSRRPRPSRSSPHSRGAPDQRALFKQLTGIVADFAAAVGREGAGGREETRRGLQRSGEGCQGVRRATEFPDGRPGCTDRGDDARGDTAGAQGVMFAALQGRVQGLHHEALTPMQQATEALGQAWKKLSTTVGDSGPIRVATDAYIGLLGLLKSSWTTCPRWCRGSRRQRSTRIPAAPCWRLTRRTRRTRNAVQPHFASGPCIGNRPVAPRMRSKLELKKRKLSRSPTRRRPNSNASVGRRGAFVPIASIKLEQQGDTSTQDLQPVARRPQSDAEEVHAALGNRGSSSFAEQLADQSPGRAVPGRRQSLKWDAASREEKACAVLPEPPHF
jgi:hypothetical protein